MISGVLAANTLVVMASAASSATSARAIEAIAEALEIDASSITVATKFEDIIPAGDSTKIVEVVQAVEIEFEDELDGEPIPEDVYPKWKTIQDGVDYLAGLEQ